MAHTTVSMMGTHGFIPPEMYEEGREKLSRGTPRNKNFVTKKLDIWSLGCVIH